jgi:hypothetical protein
LSRACGGQELNCVVVRRIGETAKKKWAMELVLAGNVNAAFEEMTAGIISSHIMIRETLFEVRPVEKQLTGRAEFVSRQKK